MSGHLDVPNDRQDVGHKLPRLRLTGHAHAFHGPSGSGVSTSRTSTYIQSSLATAIRAFCDEEYRVVTRRRPTITLPSLLFVSVRRISLKRDQGHLSTGDHWHQEGCQMALHCRKEAHALQVRRPQPDVLKRAKNCLSAMPRYQAAMAEDR